MRSAGEAARIGEGLKIIAKRGITKVMADIKKRERAL